MGARVASPNLLEAAAIVSISLASPCSMIFKIIVVRLAWI